MRPISNFFTSILSIKSLMPYRGEIIESLVLLDEKKKSLKDRGASTREESWLFGKIYFAFRLNPCTAIRGLYTRR